MNQEINHTLTDEEGNETHAIRFVQSEDTVYLRLSETVVEQNWNYGSSDIQVSNIQLKSEGIVLRMHQSINDDDTEYNIASQIVVSRDQAKRLIADLAHVL